MAGAFRAGSFYFFKNWGSRTSQLDEKIVIIYPCSHHNAGSEAKYIVMEIEK